MSAVAEIVETESERIHNWKAPPVTEGLQVYYYKSGRRSDSRPQAAYIIQNKMGRSLSLKIQAGMDGGSVRTSVRHVDDPVLADNPHQRAYGAWDYTDEWKQAREDRKRIEVLEEQVADLLTRPSAPARKNAKGDAE